MITTIYNIAANTAFLQTIDLNTSLQPNSIKSDLIYFKRWTNYVDSTVDILDGDTGMVQVETGILKPGVYILTIYNKVTLFLHFSALINVSDESIVYGYQGAQQDIQSATLVDIDGLVVALPSAGTYIFEASINAFSQTGTQGAQFGAQYTGTTTSIQFNYTGNLAITTTTACVVVAKNTAGITLLTTSGAQGMVYLSGIIVVAGAGNFSIKGQRILGGGAQHLYIRPGSFVRVLKVA